MQCYKICSDICVNAKNTQVLGLKGQNMPHQQPMNVFNVGNTSQIEFEARILNENEKPDEIPIQRRTMFHIHENHSCYLNI